MVMSVKFHRERFRGRNYDDPFSWNMCAFIFSETN